MRIFLRIILTIVILYVALVASMAIVMRQPPSTFGAIIAKLPPIVFMMVPFEPLWMRARAGSLQVGQDAPDFALKNLNGDTVVRLSAYRRQKPVVLVFGSYT